MAPGTGSVPGVDYRLVDRRPATSERYVELGADPSGQHQLLIYSVQVGLRTGWIGQHELHPFPGPQPYFGYPVTAW